jgi:ankyrin repeat protein
MSGSTVFISYRREDSAGYAGRLFDRLVDRLGHDHVFRDIESISPGDDFADSIRKRLSACDVLLVVIGPRWLSAIDQTGRKRLEDENDLVRTEIELGLQRKIRVIPVLLPGAGMPGANDLPAVLAPLAQFNAFEIREAHFDHDVAQLIKIVGTRRDRSLRTLTRAKYFYASLIATALVLALVAVFWLNPMIFMTPERARLRLMTMRLNYDAATFVQQANIGDFAAVKLFLRAGISVDETPYDQSAIVAAAEEGHLEVVKALAEAGANINRAMVAAGRGKNKAVFDYLMSRNPERKSIAGALHVAAGEGNRIDLVRDLLNRGINVDSDWGGTPLMTAAYYGRVDILNLLLDRGANVRAISEEGETALHYARRGLRDSFQIVGTLLGRGAPVNAQNRRGRTPLMEGLERREETQLLLAHKADVRLRDDAGGTVLLYAAGHNLTWLIKLLMDRGAEINTRNNDGETPLMWATGAVDSVDKPQMAQTLIDNGADVNLADQDSDTALMFAAQKGLASSVRTLLQARAQTGKQNKKGETALDLARKNDEKAVVKLLTGAR